MPELPEVESLAVFLRERATGAEIDWAASTAISVLKTYQPDLGALSGNLDLFPYEALLIIARKLGFGHALERALGGALGP